MNIVDHLSILDLSVIIVYVIILLAIGFWAGKKSEQHGGDLFLAGRQLKWPGIGLSIWGTNVGPAMLIATTGLAYSTGLVGGNFSWLAFPILLLLAKVFIPRYLHSRISTTPEYLSIRFNEQTRDIVAIYSLVSIIILWLGGTLYAGGLLISQMLGWPLWISVSVLMLISLSFTITGGLTAVVYTDTFQMVLLIISSLCLLIFGLFSLDGIDHLFTETPDNYWKLFQPLDDKEYPWHALILGYPVLGIWFWCTDQTIVQRALGAKNSQHAQKGILLTAFLKILDTFIFVIPGIICFLLFPDLKNSDEAFLTLSIGVLPQGLLGLTVSVIMATLISTVDSGLNSLSTVFTKDIYKKKINPEISKNGEKRMGQLTTFIGGVFAIFLALVFDGVNKDLFGLLQSIIGYLAPPMAAVFLLGVIWKGATSRAANTTLIVGFVICLIVAILDLGGLGNIDLPPYLLMSFYLFVFLLLFMILISMTSRQDQSNAYGYISLKDIYKKIGLSPTYLNLGWLLVITIMCTLYIYFN